MLRDFLLSLRQLDEPRFRRPLLLSLLGSAVILVLMVAGANYALFTLAYFEWSWLDWIVRVLGGVGASVIAFVLFPAVATTLQSFLLEDVARAVEDRHYPGQPPPRIQPWSELIVVTLRFLGAVLLVNLALLPVYLVLLFFPPALLAVTYAVNGYLIGREYFEMVAYRRLDAAQARALRRETRGEVWLTGVAMAALFTVPVLNLAMPVLGTAMMLHRFERIRRHAALAGGGPPSAVRRPGGGNVPSIAAICLLVAGVIAACAPRVHEAAATGPIPVDIVSSLPAPEPGAIEPGAIEPGAVEPGGTTEQPTDQLALLPPPPPPANPRELLGLRPDAVRGKLGNAGFVRREGPARVWQYTTRECIFDVFLYRDAIDFRVTHVEARGRRGEKMPDADCYQSVLSARAVSGS